MVPATGKMHHLIFLPLPHKKDTLAMKHCIYVCVQESGAEVK